MLITTGIILPLAILLVPILLIRFRKPWVAAFNLAVTNRFKTRSSSRGLNALRRWMRVLLSLGSLLQPGGGVRKA